MPFINGRHYVNPVMGEALDAAREAEAALAALENGARQNSVDGGNSGGDAGDGFADEAGGHGAAGGDGPIHRVEIEAAELVPSHSGRASHGYVARVHRQASAGGGGSQRLSGGTARNGDANGRAGEAAETHVFADHRDLLSFLRDEMAKDHSRPRRAS